MKNQAQSQASPENQFDDDSYYSDSYNENPNENYEYNPNRNQEYLKQNLNDFRVNMGMSREEKNRTTVKKFFLTILAFLLIPPTAFYLGRSIRQELPERNDPEPQIVIPQVIPAAEDTFCIVDNEVREGYLFPEDFVLLKDGETQYTISSKDEFKINKDEDFRFVSSYDSDRSSYSTQRGIQVGDDWKEFLDAYGDYRPDYINCRNADGENLIRKNITVREFKEDYIDTGKVDLTDPSLEMFFVFSLHSDGEHIIEMKDDGYFHDYDRYMEITFNFDSSDKLGNNEITENNSSTGQHLDYIDTNYYHF